MDYKSEMQQLREDIHTQQNPMGGLVNARLIELILKVGRAAPHRLHPNGGQCAGQLHLF